MVKEDDWSSGELPAAKATESWKGRTIFRILAGGIESRTSVPAKSRDPARGKKGSPGDIISKANLKTAQKMREQPAALCQKRHRSSGENAPREAFHRLRQLLRMIRIFKISILLFREIRKSFREELQRSHR